VEGAGLGRKQDGGAVFGGDCIVVCGGRGKRKKCNIEEAGEAAMGINRKQRGTPDPTQTPQTNCIKSPAIPLFV
jgi:hypothetical protein